MHSDFLETLIRMGWDAPTAIAWISSSFDIFGRICSQSRSQQRSGSLCSNLARMIANPAPLASDGLVHVPYTGTVGSMISGINRFLGTATVQPSQYKHILIFMVGGISFQEIKDLQKAFKKSESEIVVGSNFILSPSKVYQRLFGEIKSP